MPAFAWKALDSTGRYRKGVLEGDSARHVRNQLRSRSLAPVEATPTVEKGARGLRRRGAVRLTPPERALIARQIAILLQAGLPLEQALRTAAQQVKKTAHRNLLAAIRGRVAEGYGLARAMHDYPRAFPEHFVATVSAGEHSGYLAEVLERLAEHAEKSHETRQKMQLALLYPVMVTIVAVLVVTALVTYVVPEVVQVFEHMDQALPPLTVGLIVVSEWLRDYGGGTLLLLIAALFLARWLVRRRIGLRRQLHRLWLGLPGVGGFVRGMLAARFCRTCGMLIDSGVPATDATAIAAGVIPLLPMREALTTAMARLKEGVSMRAALEETGYFTPLMINLVASGEAGGRLGEMLLRGADTQERDNAAAVATLVGVFEPLLILIMGGVVLMVVLAILLPIFEMNQLVS